MYSKVARMECGFIWGFPPKKWRWNLMEMAFGVLQWGKKGVEPGFVLGGCSIRIPWLLEPICCMMMSAQNSESMFVDTRLLALTGGRLCAIQLSPHGMNVMFHPAAPILPFNDRLSMRSHLLQKVCQCTSNGPWSFCGIEKYIISPHLSDMNELWDNCHRKKLLKLCCDGRCRYSKIIINECIRYLIAWPRFGEREKFDRL